MFFKRRRERKRAEEQRARELLEQMHERQRELAGKLARRQERMEQRAREREVFGESAEQAQKYDAIAARLFDLVVELGGPDLADENRSAQIVEEIRRTGAQLDDDGGLELMQVVCGRVTELGHAAAARARRDTTAVTYESHQQIQSIYSAGRILEEEWKGIGQWR